MSGRASVSVCSALRADCSNWASSRKISATSGANSLRVGCAVSRVAAGLSTGFWTGGDSRRSEGRSLGSILGVG